MKFAGIDLAGDSGRTGVAILTNEMQQLHCTVLDDWFCGESGLSQLVQLVNQSTLCAVDQPFGYSAAVLHMLGVPFDERDAIEPSVIGVAEGCWRRTDIGMRQILKGYGLKVDGVMSPNRCQNIWRALALISRAGLSRPQVCMGQTKVVETHPRVSLARLLPDNVRATLAARYKSADDQDASEARNLALNIFENMYGLSFNTESDRFRATLFDDCFEAVVAAIVAWLHHNGKTDLCGFGEADCLLRLPIEGAAVVPVESVSCP